MATLCRSYGVALEDEKQDVEKGPQVVENNDEEVGRQIDVVDEKQSIWKQCSLTKT